MTYATGMPHDVSLYDPSCSSRRVSPQTLYGAVALACSVFVSAWVLDARLVAAPDVHQAPAAASADPKVEEAPAVASATPKPDAASAAAPETIVAAKPDGALLDPAFFLGLPSRSFGQTAMLGPDFAPIPPAPPAKMAEAEDVVPAPMPAALELAQSAPAIPAAAELAQSTPLPVVRPPELRLQASQGSFRTFGRQVAQQTRPAVLPAAPRDNRTFLEKLFGMPQQPSGPVLAYATPEAGVLGRAQSLTSSPVVPYDRWTAIYDIAAHTVYMPDGTRLEAHSGLGERLDDPRYVSQRDRGATPPHVYDLEPRAQPFHGVQALRLNPVGDGGTFGRTGFLAHTYMLGPNGDSNGCVSFKNYDAFLQAYLNGEVKRLAVVARLI